MEPRIRYARTSDGVNIAFWTLGEGEPLVCMPLSLWGHCQLEWEWPEWRAWYERLASTRMLIRYDWRGTGLSDRHVSDLSPGAHLLDLEAVIDRLGFQTFRLLGNYAGCPSALRYTAQHRERVSALLLWCPVVNWSDIQAGMQQLTGIAGNDWHSYTQLAVQLLLGSAPGREQARRALAFMRESVDVATYSASLAYRGADASGLLPHIAVPTLVLHRRDIAVPPMEVPRYITSRIPNARLIVLEGTSLWPFHGDSEAALQAIQEFLGDGRPAIRTQPPAGTVIILYADIADSTALTERMGDSAFREKARALDDALRIIVRENGGMAIDGKLVGDGIMATFQAASEAIASALAYEHAAAPIGLGLHIGLHAGDVMREANNVYGGAVNIAARISALAPPGEVFVSRTVADLARTSAGVTFEDRGEHALKGIAEPQQVFAVRASEAG